MPSVTTQTLAITSGSAIRIDPRSVSALSDDTQYAVVADGIGGRIDAIVIELATGGDNAMIYEGFPAPQERAPAHFNSPSDPSVRSDRSAAALRR